MGVSLFDELRSLALVRRLMGLDSDKVKNGFFANYLAGLLMIKMQDLRGISLMHDPANMKLDRFRPGMTDITFWGRALFFPNDDLVKRALQPGHAALLDKDAGRILNSRVHKTLAILTTPPEQVDWRELGTALIMLRYRFELNSSYFNKIVLNLINWDNLSSAGRRNTVSTAYAYLLQADPKSALLSRIRELSGPSMISNIKATAAKLVGIIKEDDAGGTSTANIASGEGSTCNNAIITRFGPENSIAGLLTIQGKAPHQVGDKSLDANKKIKLRQRKFKIVRFKMPKKDNKHA